MCCIQCLLKNKRCRAGHSVLVVKTFFTAMAQRRKGEGGYRLIASWRLCGESFFLLYGRNGAMHQGFSAAPGFSRSGSTHSGTSLREELTMLETRYAFIFVAG